MDSLFNFPLFIGVSAILLAQLSKPFLYYFKTKQWLFSSIKTTGGMPSSHSAGVMAVASSIGFEAGFSSPLFAVAATLAGIVMYDATGVRNEAGKHAHHLNTLTSELKSDATSSKLELPTLKTKLGHKGIEVLVGAVFGTIYATCFYAIRYFL